MVRMDTRIRAAQAVIRRRLLVNALVDPDEAATRLPAGLRPHVTELGTVVGCCLLDIVQLRPTGLPAGIGIGLRAAACRISTEWDDDAGEPVVGVYVPSRLTPSRLAVAMGGRWFPGTHRRGRFDVVETADRSTWQVEAAGGGGHDIRVTVAIGPGTAAAAGEPVGATCLEATVGLSPDRRGRLEAVRMAPADRAARPIEVEDLRCDFLTGFGSLRPAPTYLMEHVATVWSPAPAPTRTSSTGAAPVGSSSA